MGWGRYAQHRAREARLEQLAREVELSTGYLYGLLELTRMAAAIKEDPRNADPRNALWHSWFAYRTRRLVESKIRGGEDREAVERKRKALVAELGAEIAQEGIGRFGADYKIALFAYLYQQRD